MLKVAETQCTDWARCDAGPWRKLVVRVTPELAREWLLRSNEKNRRINWDRVRGYAAANLRGELVASPMATPICFDPEFSLLNGHHRLHAVETSGRAADFIVCFGVPREHLKFGDIGIPRSANQIGRMFGEPTRYDASLVVIDQIINGTKRWLSPVDRSELRTEWESETAAVAKLADVRLQHSKRPFRAGFVGGAMMCFRIDPDGMREFLEDFVPFVERRTSAAQASSASVNLLRWYEGRPSIAGGGHAVDDASGVAQAYAQFVSKTPKLLIKPHGGQQLERVVAELRKRASG